MNNSNNGRVQAEYKLILVDEEVKDFPSDTQLSIHSRSLEFVPELDSYELGGFFKSKSEISTLYVSYNPGKLQLAHECGIDTCFLNNGINDIADFDKAYEIPYTKRLVK